MKNIPTKTMTILVHITQLVDIAFALSYFIVFIGFVGHILNSSGKWTMITFGEFFNNNGLWFGIWILTLLYVPIRLILKEKFWSIIIGRK